jgi:hypothetical protein
MIRKKGYLIFICLAAALALSGCQSSSTESNASAVSTSSPSTEAAKKEVEHEHSAPHGGTLIELGEEFAHIEVVLDTATGRLTAYALDGEAEEAIRIKQTEIEIAVKNLEATIKLSGVANVLTGETPDDSSEFSGQSESLRGATDFAGVIKTISIKGKEFKDIAFNFPNSSEKQ